jgi:hypothetical protein
MVAMGRLLEGAWAKSWQALRASFLRCGLDSIARAKLAIATLALVNCSLGSLQLAVVLVNPAWFENLCSIFDASQGFAGVTTLLFAGPIVTSLVLDYFLVDREPWPWPWQRRATRIALVASIADVVAESVILRGPWLLGEAGRFDRVSVWTAKLSSTYAGVPWTAFGLSLGYAILLWCVTSAFVRAYAVTTEGARGQKSRLIRVSAWVWCAFLFVTGFAALCSFATGGAV